jgi:hypothetical protein
MDQSPERSIRSFRPHEKALSIAKGCFAGSQEAPAARHSPLCKLDHELEQRVSMRYFVAITRVRHHSRSTSLSLIPSRRPRALPPLFVCQLLIWRLKLALTTGFREWDKTPACPFRRGLGLQLVTGGPPRGSKLESCRIAPLTTVVCGLV